MIYTEMTKKAIRFAFRAHAGQMDRSGIPYIMHPIHLAEQMSSEDACVVAMLHDVLEDTDVTLEELLAEGFTETQLTALQLLTHDEAVPYMDYIRNLKENELAKTVKLADLAHNSDLTRLDTVTEKDLERNRKYAEAIRILTN